MTESPMRRYDAGRNWQSGRSSKRNDSTFGLAYGDYPNVTNGSDSREVGFHPRRMSRARLDPILNRLHDSHGNPMGQLWAERSDGTRPNSYPLIFLFSSLKWDRGVNYGRGYIAMNVEDRYEIPRDPFQANRPIRSISPAASQNNLSWPPHSRLPRGGALFGLGDEYSEKGTLPQSREIDQFYGNLQKHSDLLDSFNDIDGDRIKWRWHRIRKATVLMGAIGKATTGVFRIPIPLGQPCSSNRATRCFCALGDTPTPYRAIPDISEHCRSSASRTQEESPTSRSRKVGQSPGRSHHGLSQIRSLIYRRRCGTVRSRLHPVPAGGGQ